MEIQPEQFTQLIEALEAIRSAIATGWPILCFCIIVNGLLPQNVEGIYK